MNIILGAVIVIGGVVGGYLMAGGNLSILFQPAELIVICGAALGSFIISSPIKVVKASIQALIKSITAKPIGKAAYTDLLLCIFELLTFVRREGAVAVETHVNRPDQSRIFTGHPTVLENHHVRDFICDNFKVYISGKMEPHEFDALMEIDIDAHHEVEAVIPSSVNKVADSLPGMGIVAAVLGVVITMGKINEPPEVLGHSIGAALVGTFLGILLCYGFLGPMAGNLEHINRANAAKFHVVKAAMAAFAQGWPPAMAIEAARRAVPGDERPSFAEMEEQMRAARK